MRYVLELLGVAVFAVSGVLAAGRKGPDLVGVAVIAELMGTITGVAGGVVRDVLTAQIPLVMRPGRLYATAAIVGASSYVLPVKAGVAPDAAALTGMGATAALRFAAILWRLELPTVRLPEESESDSR